MRLVPAHKWTDTVDIHAMIFDRGDKYPTCDQCPDRALYKHGTRNLCWSHAKALYDVVVRLTDRLTQ